MSPRGYANGQDMNLEFTAFMEADGACSVCNMQTTHDIDMAHGEAECQNCGVKSDLTAHDLEDVEFSLLGDVERLRALRAIRTAEAIAASSREAA